MSQSDFFRYKELPIEFDFTAKRFATADILPPAKDSKLLTEASQRLEQILGDRPPVNLDEADGLLSYPEVQKLQDYLFTQLSISREKVRTSYQTLVLLSQGEKVTKERALALSSLFLKLANSFKYKPLTQSQQSL